ncbi:type III toxin-antitoxin system ToxN/AbiQ family toxin [Lentilactobacillus kefiri]|uniref:type III toxin-antitoxin system ToxN/AbiQ family toxin n=1 Tax=Lentilactobacillus kefiri TaxID=33962 RepID=UPI00345E4699
MTEINFYCIPKEYIDYLRQIDSKVPNANYHERGFHEKIYCGAVILVGSHKYFAPLSHQTSNPETSFLIKHRNGEEFASLRLKFMLPVDSSLMTIKDISDEHDEKYQGLLSEELTYCRQNASEIRELAQIVYNNRIHERRGFQYFCCDFKALEEAACLYN